MASEKQMATKFQAAQNTADEWLRRAELAVRKGQDELAREALLRRKTFDQAAASLKVGCDLGHAPHTACHATTLHRIAHALSGGGLYPEGLELGRPVNAPVVYPAAQQIQLDAQRRALDQLQGNVRVLEGKLTEARNKRETLKARAASAKSSKQIQEVRAVCADVMTLVLHTVACHLHCTAVVSAGLTSAGLTVDSNQGVSGRHVGSLQCVCLAIGWTVSLVACAGLIVCVCLPCCADGGWFAAEQQQRVGCF